MHDLESRVLQLEARSEIASLPPRYARAADSRDLDELVALFVPDVDLGRAGRGRDALRKALAGPLRMFYRSIHLVCGHVIDELEEERARGTTYCRAEQEVDDRWMISALMYEDDYARVDGRWLFSRRVPRVWYHADLLERPSEVGLHNWPDMEQFKVSLPGRFSAWDSFWVGARTRSRHPVRPPTTGQPATPWASSDQENGL